MGVIGGLNGLGGGVATGLGLNNVGGPGWLARVGGQLGGYMATSLSGMLPGALGPIFQGMGSTLGGLFTEALSHPFAKFQLQIIEAQKQTLDFVSKGWGNVDQAASSYAKQFGLMGDQYAKMRDQMIKFGNENQIAAKYNKSTEEAIKLQAKLNSEVGRTVMMSDKQQESMLALSAVVGDDMAVKFTAALDKFGVSATGAGDMMTKMFKEANKSGISAEKYAKNVTDHLSMAHKYNFKNGINGLKSMAELATKIKMDMDMVAQFADKVSTVGGAVEMGAQLQVLGGPFAGFANPMRLLYGGLNDMEDLGKQVAKLTENLGVFDKNTGTFDIKSSFDRIRLREAAKIMGMDYGKLIEQATTQAKRKEVESQMVGLTNIPEEYKELLMNNATFENGVAGIRGADGTWKSLSKLGKADFEQLVNDTKSEAENIADIAEMLRGYMDVQSGYDKAKANEQAEQYATQAERHKEMMLEVSQSREALQKLNQLDSTVNTANQWGGIVSGVMNTVMTGLMLFGGKGRRFRMRAKGGPLGGQEGLVRGLPGIEKVPLGGDGSYTVQGGEFVMNGSAVQRGDNLALMKAMNKGKTFRMRSEGGPVEGEDTGGNSALGYTAALTYGVLKTPQIRTAINNTITEVHLNRSINKLRQAELGARNHGRFTTQSNAIQNRIRLRENPGYLQRLKNVNATKTNQALTGISNVSTKLGNSVSKLTNGVSKLTNGVSKITSGAANLVEKGTTKVIGKTATKLGGKLLGGVGAGALSGFLEWQDAKDSGEDIMNRKHAKGKAIGAGVGAGIGGFIGSFIFPPLGTIVGSILGEWIGKGIGGAYSKTDDNESRKVFKELYDGMKNKKGKTKFSLLGGGVGYDKDELKKISSALNDGDITDGEIDDYLKEKIIRKGGQNTVLYQGKLARGIASIPGKSHSEGGVWANLEGGEGVIPKNSVNKNPDIVNKLVNDEDYFNKQKVKANKPMGEQMQVTNNVNSNPTSSTINIKPIDIKINGSIKLEGNNQSVDIIKLIKDDPNVKNEIIALIQRNLNIHENNKGFDKHNSQIKNPLVG